MSAFLKTFFISSNKVLRGPISFKVAYLVGSSDFRDSPLLYPFYSPKPPQHTLPYFCHSVFLQTTTFRDHSIPLFVTYPYYITYSTYFFEATTLKVIMKSVIINVIINKTAKKTTLLIENWYLSVAYINIMVLGKLSLILQMRCSRRYVTTKVPCVCDCFGSLYSLVRNTAVLLCGTNI